MTIPPQHRKKVAWLAVCIGCVAGFEGLRTTPYYDIGGVPTDCYGETQGVQMTDRPTPEQCKDMLAARIERDFGPGVDKCVKHELPVKRKAAYTSLAYNIGVARFCSSSVARLENAGQPAAACEAIMKYDQVRVNGVLVESKGLKNRRTEERKLCIEGLS